MRSQVQVGICLRPLVENEIENGAKNVVEIVGKRLHFNNSTTPTGYDFEWMFGPSNLQTRLVYDSMISPLIDNFFQGFTATVFAYGQTGSGKTYLMGSSLPSSGHPIDDFESEILQLPDDSDKENSSRLSETNNLVVTQKSGIIPFSLDDIFRKKSQLQTEGATVQLEMSYLEIYQEECYDLLSFLSVQPKDSNKENCKRNIREKDQTGKNHNRPSNLEMRENSKGETFLEGLTAWPVANKTEVNRLLAAAAKARATGKTAMNARSSRSHAIATLSLRITTNDNRTIRYIDSHGTIYNLTTHTER